MSVDWRFPMKPVPISRTNLVRMDMSKYTMELKFDGHRAIVVSESRSMALWTRQKVRIKTPKNLQEQLVSLRLPEGTILDGEIWNPTKRGGWDTESSQPCILSLWDCVRYGLKDLSAEIIERRRGALGELLRGGTEHIRQVESHDASTILAEEIEREARNFRQSEAFRSGYVHGIVLKRRGSIRRDHAVRSQEHPDWLKLVFPGMSGWETRPA